MRLLASRCESYTFGEFTLEPRRRRLLDARGRELRLGARAFDTLLCLVEHAGETLGKRQLIDAVWPRAVVEENSLMKAVSILRRTLGQAAHDSGYILTIPGEGYRFVAPVQIGTSEQRNFHGPLCRPSIAFLPLDNLTGDPRHDVDADCLTEDLTTAFADSDAYVVASRSSCCRFKQTSHGARKAGHDLHADYVVEGSLQDAADGGLRLTVQLIDVATDAHVFTYAITSADRSLAAFQREIGVGGTGLTVFLQCALWRHYVAALGGTGPADLLSRLRPESLSLAAVCGLYGRDDVSQEELGGALTALDAAAELCPRDVYALTLLGMTLVGLPGVNAFAVPPAAAKARYQRALALFDRALAVGQGAMSANNLAGIGFWLAGQWKRARPLLERALRERSYPMLRSFAAQWRLYVEEDVDATIAELSAALDSERNQTHLEQHIFLLLVGIAHLVRGEWAEAIRRLEEAHAVAPAEAGPAAALVTAHVLAGDLHAARRLAGAILAHTPGGQLRDIPFRRACLHPERSGIEPTSRVGRLLCWEMPRALKCTGLDWVVPPEDASPATSLDLSLGRGVSATFASVSIRGRR